MMNNLEERLGYKYKNKKYLDIALTHSSYAHEKKGNVKCNERLEFLGDSVLSIVVSDYIFKKLPYAPEGELTKLRASLVCEKSLCNFAKKVGLGEYLKLSRGERRSGGAERPSILADAFEAIIASIYLDGGLEKSRKFILRFIIPCVENPKPISFRDYKTDLQEIIQKNPGNMLEYLLVEESGPDHDKHFVIEVILDNNVIGRGGGKSKKEAEQQAAREALELMGY